jgi:hypothetical protein
VTPRAEARDDRPGRGEGRPASLPLPFRIEAHRGPVGDYGSAKNFVTDAGLTQDTRRTHPRDREEPARSQAKFSTWLGALGRRTNAPLTASRIRLPGPLRAAD